MKELHFFCFRSFVSAENRWRWGYCKVELYECLVIPGVQILGPRRNILLPFVTQIIRASSSRRVTVSYRTDFRSNTGLRISLRSARTATERYFMVLTQCLWGKSACFRKIIFQRFDWHFGIGMKAMIGFAPNWNDEKLNASCCLSWPVCFSLTLLKMAEIRPLFLVAFDSAGVLRKRLVMLILYACGFLIISWNSRGTSSHILATTGLRSAIVMSAEMPTRASKRLKLSTEGSEKSDEVAKTSGDNETKKEGSGVTSATETAQSETARWVGRFDALKLLSALS